ncbi:S9 family peptidase [Natrinema pallidum]|uniref:Alpha/beta hydrolase n=1 Tax=Natrinema pallidum TaxID=69527 RepID=A0A4P9TCP3_9EURY|nr:alpha/beta fold hydrolase [Natrinema pallidum]QCW02466.1 alpha/beta hydrolase [Natrinema pallidum]
MPEAHRIPVGNATTDAAPTVAAVHHEADSDDWLVWCHGLRSDKSGSYEARCRRASEAGYNAVRFDARGCGESDGQFVDSTLETRLTDLRHVVDYFDPRSYALFGSSFGGKVAVHAAAEDERVEAVAARAPVTTSEQFDEYRTVVEREGAWTFDTGDRIERQFFDALERYPFDDVVGELDVPVAIFHGGDDAVVDPADSFAAAARLETDVLVERFAGEGHRFSATGEQRLRDRLFDWLAWADARQ